MKTFGTVKIIMIELRLTNYRSNYQRDSLVCGAYESVEDEKLILSSEKESLAEDFSMGTIFVSNDSNDIANVIIRSINNIEYYKNGMLNVKIC